MDNDHENQKTDSSNPSSKKPSLGLIATIVVLLLVGLTIFWMQKNKTKNNEAVTNAMHTENPNDGDGDHDNYDSSDTIKFDNGQQNTGSASSSYLSGNSITVGDINSKKITITGSNYKFEPNQFTVKKGDVVTVVFQNSGGMHDFVIDEFKVKSKTVSGGGSDTITFTADKTGTFEFYCSVGNHREMGMKGSLIVE